MLCSRKLDVWTMARQRSRKIRVVCDRYMPAADLMGTITRYNRDVIGPGSQVRYDSWTSFTEAIFCFTRFIRKINALQRQKCYNVENISKTLR